MVIAVAIVLFILAAFAGPRRPAAPEVTAPSATPAPAGTPAATEGATASPGPPATPSAPATPTETPSPVATADQIVAEEVGDYVLGDRTLSDAGADSGALESVELRYELTPPTDDTEILHAIEIHLDDAAARERVETFGAAMEQTGYEVLREQTLRDEDGTVQGYFISLRGSGQPLLLWSNRNATFTLGGGTKADVNAFYEDLPY